MAPAVEFEEVSKRFIVHHERPRSFQELAVSFFHRNNTSRDDALSRSSRTCSSSFILHPSSFRGDPSRRDSASEELWALREVSFAVERGETLGLIGPNGAGKSTALKLISRILEPTSGRIRAHGRVSALLELGAGFHPDLTGRENVYLNGSILGLSRREMRQKFDSIVRFTELERFIDMPVKHYSSGMYMRLGFAIAIHVDPDILLIDEILAVGDQSFQRKCLDRIHEMRRRGVTILFVSHSLEAVQGLCHRAIWLEGGQVQAEGMAREVVDRYLMQVHEKERGALAKQAPPAEALPGEEPSGETPAEGGKTRWGTREVEITSVRLLNGGGEETLFFESGQPAAVEIGYRVNRPAEAPVFGIAIYRADGTHCYGTNTDIEEIPTDGLGGAGVVRVAFDRFAFIEGTYTLDVAVHTRDGYPYDYHRPYCTFAVRSRLRDGGVFRPQHRWEIATH
jgi:ABC-type polysaccharide/polyol phosphate transport system ATPase subunit